MSLMVELMCKFNIFPRLLQPIKHKKRVFSKSFYLIILNVAPFLITLQQK